MTLWNPLDHMDRSINVIALQYKNGRPLVKIRIVHIQDSTIHPFHDLACRQSIFGEFVVAV